MWVTLICPRNITIISRKWTNTPSPELWADRTFVCSVRCHIHVFWWHIFCTHFFRTRFLFLHFSRPLQKRHWNNHFGCLCVFKSFYHLALFFLYLGFLGFLRLLTFSLSESLFKDSVLCELDTLYETVPPINHSPLKVVNSLNSFVSHFSFFFGVLFCVQINWGNCMREEEIINFYPHLHIEFIDFLESSKKKVLFSMPRVLFFIYSIFGSHFNVFFLNFWFSHVFIRPHNKKGHFT